MLVGEPVCHSADVRHSPKLPDPKLAETRAAVGEAGGVSGSVSGVGYGPVSLKALAGHLGLSSAAVSRVLNGTPAARSIPRATQERIFAAAKALNYRPNLFARSLRNRRSQTIGVLVPEVSEGYATLVLSGIEQQLLEAEYFYFLVSHRHQPAAIARAVGRLEERAIEGIIAIDTRLESRPAVPTVTVSGHGEPEGCVQICLNHRRAAELAMGHLRELGHREIAYMKGQSFSSDTEARWRGIRHVAAAMELPIRPELVSTLEGEDPTHEPGTGRRSGCWQGVEGLRRCLRSMMFRRLGRCGRCARRGCGCRGRYRWWGSTMCSRRRFRTRG